jgi:hypothetical protein
MWLALSNKVLTWDNLQKRNKHCPGWRYICKGSEEFISHLLISCSYTSQVWKKLEAITGFKILGVVILLKNVSESGMGI